MAQALISQDINVQNKRLIEIVNELLDLSCQSIEDFVNKSDIHKIQPLESASSIGIEEVLQFQKELKFKPFEKKTQVGIIFESQKMTPQAQNALLKTLEEQGESTEFILLVDNEHNLLDTILSRCKKYYLKEISESATTPVYEIDIEEFLCSDLVSKFAYIETIVEQEKKSTGTIENFISALLSYFRVQLIQNIATENSSEITDKINKILTVQNRLHSNVNKKLILENLLLEIS